MSAGIFVDTNLLVYARDASETEKQPRAAEWLALLWETRRGRLSVQVLHEYYVTVTRKLDPGMPAEEAREDVLSLYAWRPVPLSVELAEAAWDLEERHPIAFWDALIIAAAERAGTRVLLSEDLSHDERYGDVHVVNPFRTEPADLLD